MIVPILNRGFVKREVQFLFIAPNAVYDIDIKTNSPSNFSLFQIKPM